MTHLRRTVTFAPMTLLLLGVAASLVDLDAFLAVVTGANTWILRYFANLFNWGSFGFVLTIVWVWFSPLGKVRIGGEAAVPILSRWNWFAITLCTTIAIGILFWATAEPLYHFHEPPAISGIEPASEGARRFAMSSLFMHWTITPYAIYTVPSLAFALAYHNLGRGYSLSAPLSLTLGTRLAGNPSGGNPSGGNPSGGNPSGAWSSSVIDAVALFALVAGMSASLGVGILSISSGLASTLGITAGAGLLALVAAAIVGAFMVSSVSGLMRGIRILSDWNVRFFFLLCAVLLVVGPTAKVFSYGAQGVIDFAAEFLPRSLGQGALGDTAWSRDWTTFYWANWLAWAPITALFLGRIARGYTVRQFITFNLVLPSSFAIVWMSIFGASAIEFDQAGTSLYVVLTNSGPESVIYALFESLPLPGVWASAFVLLSFVCFVTAADSNTEAISGLCQREDAHMSLSEEERRPVTLRLKIVWAGLIGVTAWIMVSFSGVDGVRMLSNLGGLPALFIVMLMNIALVIMGTQKLADVKNAVGGS